MPKTIINGAIKILNLPDIECFTTLAEWAQTLAGNLSIEIDGDNLSGVVVSVDQPSANALDKLWIRRSASGTIIGAFVYSGGKWVQLFPAPMQVFWLYGNSAQIPQGYRMITQGDGTFTTADFTKLIAQAILAPNGVDYVLYPALFVGV